MPDSLETRRAGLMHIENPQSILVIKLRYIGDVVLSTPVLSRLREGFPKARITMLVNAGTEEVVQGHRALDEVLIVGRGSMTRLWRLLSEIRCTGVVCVYDPYGAARC